jgi:hypothetical protein
MTGRSVWPCVFVPRAITAWLAIGIGVSFFATPDVALSVSLDRVTAAGASPQPAGTRAASEATFL